ncbi:hypothetical protein SLA2020_106390 [Shorea laevis]
MGRALGTKANAPASKFYVELQSNHSTFSMAMLFFCMQSSIIFWVVKSSMVVHIKLEEFIVSVSSDNRIISCLSEVLANEIS